LCTVVFCVFTKVLLTVHYEPEEIYQRKEISTISNMETSRPGSPPPYQQICGSSASNSPEIHCVAICFNMANSFSNR